MKTRDYNGRKALDRWAKDNGWATFDVFLATGGSILACREDLLAKRDQIDDALFALLPIAPTRRGQKPLTSPVAVIGPDALAAAEADQAGDEPDPHNAAVEGQDAE